MGIDARLTFFAKDQKTAEDAGKAAFDRIADLDSTMSDYRKDSELMRLCDRAGGPAVRISPDLFRVLERALQVSEISNGAFDITVGPLVSLWRKARKTFALPGLEELDSARQLVGFRYVHLDKVNRTARLDRPGMKLDLGGIAKGYAGDEAQKVFRQHGINRAMVEMGGDIVVSGPPPGKTGWTIRVPNAGSGNTAKDLEFANCAVSTSGDTEQFVVIGGVQYSHVVDPRTGWALTNRVQATIVAKEGLTADPISKIPALLDHENYRRVLEFYGIRASYVKRVSGTHELVANLEFRGSKY